MFSSNVGSSLDTSVINSYKAEQPTPNLVPRPFARGQDKMAGHPLSSLTIKLTNTLVFYILPVKTGYSSLKQVLLNWYFIIMWPLLYLHAAWLKLCYCYNFNSSISTRLSCWRRQVFIIHADILMTKYSQIGGKIIIFSHMPGPDLGFLVFSLHQARKAPGMRLGQNISGLIRSFFFCP